MGQILQPEPGRDNDAPTTLGDLLFGKKSKPYVAESEWSELVQRVSNGDELALHALYSRMYRLVFTVMLKMTNNRETAEELTVDVFHEVWRRASSYDPAGGSVIGWIMNMARSRAIDRLRFEQRKKRAGQRLGQNRMWFGRPLNLSCERCGQLKRSWAVRQHETHSKDF